MIDQLVKIKTILFVDEIKFSKKNNDADDSHYLIGVLVKIESLKVVREKFGAITANLSKGFHASKLYKKKAPNTELMKELTDLISDYNLKCFVFKYDKKKLYEPTKKHLINLGFEESEKFKNHEFQALFYFIQSLDLYLNIKLNKIDTPMKIFFDRGVYGVKEDEVFEVDSNVLGTITFCSKKRIDLLALPDHFGYIFRNCRVKYNRQNGPRNLSELQVNESNTELLNNCIANIITVFNKNLFVFLDIDKWFEEMQKKNSTG